MCENRSRVAGMWCGYCYANLKGKSCFSGHLKGRKKGAHNVRRDMALTKPQLDAGAGGLTRELASSDAAALWPHVMEYVTGECWADGSARTTASLLLFYETGLFKVCLNDRACERTGWATGPTPEQALSSLDKMLASDGLEWRKAKAQPGRRK